MLFASFKSPLETLVKFVSVILALWLTSCDDKISIPQGALDEQTVDLQGTWRVQKAFANGQDITELFDFGQIVLTLKMNEGPTDFEIENGDAPFPVTQNGSWVYNDLVYPTMMIFSTVSVERSLGFAAPPISGNTSFSLQFSLGCADNVYVYQFEKQP